MKKYQIIFFSITLIVSMQTKPSSSSSSSSDNEHEAYMTQDQYGNHVLVDPEAAAFIAGVAELNKQIRIKHDVDCIKPHMRAQDVPLLMQEDRMEDIHLAAKAGDIPALTQALTAQGVTVNLPTNVLQYTPLHFASRFGHLDAVKFLLGRGATKTAQSKTGSTPLHLAARHYHDTVVEELATEASTTDAVDNNLNTALHGAAIGLDAVTIAKLCARNAQFLPNGNQQTPLDVARQSLTMTQQPGFNPAALPKSFDPAKSMQLLLAQSQKGAPACSSSSSSSSAPGGPVAKK